MWHCSGGFCNWNLFASCPFISLTLPIWLWELFFFLKNLPLFILLNKGYQPHIQSGHGAFQCLETFLNSCCGRSNSSECSECCSQSCRESSYFLGACDLFFLNVKTDWVNSLLKFLFAYIFTVLQKKTNRRQLTWFLILKMFCITLDLESLDLTIHVHRVHRTISSMGTWCYLHLFDHHTVGTHERAAHL